MKESSEGKKLNNKIIPHSILELSDIYKLKESL